MNQRSVSVTFHSFSGVMLVNQSTFFAKNDKNVKVQNPNAYFNISTFLSINVLECRETSKDTSLVVSGGCATRQKSNTCSNALYLPNEQRSKIIVKRS